MKLEPTAIDGAWVVRTEPRGDERGWFARTFDAAAFAGAGIDFTVVQANASWNPVAGTLRGLHLQAEPHGEPKLVSCVRGAAFDVAVDLRPQSPTYRRWHAVELSADNRLAFFLPAGLAHGYQTLTGDCELHYLMGHEYVPEAATGVRWDDPAFGIEWPPAPPGGRTIAARDLEFPDHGA